jgi:MFS family permease
MAGLATGGLAVGLYRAGEQLLVVGSPSFPDSCVRCEQPAEGYRKKVNLSWHHPLVYLGILAGALPYAVLAIAMSKRATLHLPVCPGCRRRRGWALALVWASLAVLIGGIVGSAVLDRGEPLLAGFLLFLVMVIIGAVMAPIVAPARIDDYSRVWLKRVAPGYLQGLPTGPME